MSGYRLKQGGRVDRSRRLRFSFDGRAYEGVAGDTLASALLANGVSVAGRSFKYHRPRGVMAAGLEEANVVVEVGRGANAEPNLKATEIELVDGLEARSVNAWPSARRDVLSAIFWMRDFIPAGFYYKTFIKPSWRLYEGAIRRAAGLGRAPETPDADRYEKKFAHADIVIVGGGAAGLAAALAASAGGARTILIDGGRDFGGSLLGRATAIDGRDPQAWIDTALAKLGARPHVTLLTRTLVTGYYDHDMLAACERVFDNGSRLRFWKIRARKVVLATGAFERPLVFPDNDRPGIVLAGAAATYVERFGVAPGRRAVVATTNDSAYDVARTLKRAGIPVAAIVDLRASPAGAAVAAARAAGIEILHGSAPIATRGRHGLKSVSIAPVDACGRATANATRSIDCDLLCVSGGWSPALHLFAQAGGIARYDDTAGRLVAVGQAQNALLAGAARGADTLAQCFADGFSAGAEAARAVGHAPLGGFALPSVDEYRPSAPAGVFEIKPFQPTRARAWVDLQNDVTASDIRLAARENYRSVEHLKRYTTLGMAIDQGKTSNVNAIGIMAEATGREAQALGATRFRPPFSPVTLGALAGRETGERYRPLKRMPAHAAHEASNARFEDYGGWLRPAFYAQGGENEAAAVAREVKAVRNGVGIFDASPLGKIEVSGPDAQTFLDRLYVNDMRTLGIGRARYGLMLDEYGIVKDDGVLERLGEDRFLVGTTSGNASAIALWLEEWHGCEWPDLELTIAPVTADWAVVAVAGPSARTLLQRFDSDIAFDGAGFPHMSVRLGTFAGVRARVARISFTGELSYEISVPARYGEALWRELAARGADLGVVPCGIEAWMVMRTEKGYLHVGSDTDGTTMPQDVGFAAILSKKASDFVGKRSTRLEVGLDRNRRHFVGLDSIDGRGPLPIGAHAFDAAEPKATRRSHGWVTTTCMSPTLGRPVALAMIENGRARLGETVTLFGGGATRLARIVEPCAYDIAGERLNA